MLRNGVPGALGFARALARDDAVVFFAQLVWRLNAVAHVVLHIVQHYQRHAARNNGMLLCKLGDFSLVCLVVGRKRGDFFCRPQPDNLLGLCVRRGIHRKGDASGDGAAVAELYCYVCLFPLKDAGYAQVPRDGAARQRIDIRDCGAVIVRADDAQLFLREQGKRLLRAERAKVYVCAPVLGCVLGKRIVVGARAGVDDCDRRLCCAAACAAALPGAYAVCKEQDFVCLHGAESQFQAACTVVILRAQERCNLCRKFCSCGRRECLCFVYAVAERGNRNLGIARCKICCKQCKLVVAVAVLH